MYQKHTDFHNSEKCQTLTFISALVFLCGLCWGGIRKKRKRNTVLGLQIEHKR